MSALQAAFGNERFNRELRALIKQDVTPESLTDEEFLTFLNDAMEICLAQCWEEEKEELEKISDALGLSNRQNNSTMIEKIWAKRQFAKNRKNAAG